MWAGVLHIWSGYVILWVLVGHSAWRSCPTKLGRVLHQSDLMVLFFNFFFFPSLGLASQGTYLKHQTVTFLAAHQDHLSENMNDITEPRWTLVQVQQARMAFQNFKSILSKPYQYRQLGKREIRLLKISLPAVLDSSNPMPRLEIEHTPLDSAPQFKALSYCWGSPNQPSFKAPIGNVKANQGVETELPFVSLTESLAEILMYLPRHCLSSDQTTSYIWIDQICIDQSKNGEEEKTSQIGLMGEIYSKAERVLIWLGPGPDPATAQTIGEVLAGGEGFDRRLKIWKGPEQSNDAIAMQYVLQAPWFSRTWVVQESALASYKRRALVGLHPVCWDAIQEMSFIHADAKHSTPSSRIDQHQAAVLMWRAFCAASWDSDISRGILFCALLARFGQFLSAGDPKDKVLAYMSLWQPRSFDISSTTEESHCEVYTRFAKSLLQDTKRLDVLAAVRSAPVHSGQDAADGTTQPSWVPRWDVEDLRQTWSPLLAANFAKRPSTIQWNASLPHIDHIYVLRKDLTLTTRGRIICRVSQLFPLITTQLLGDFPLAEFKTFLQFEDFSITLPKAIRILFECTQLGREPEEEGEKQLKNIVDKALSSDHVLEELAQHLQEHCWMGYSPHGRRFFTAAWPGGTETRHGLAPGYAKAEDEIAILHGARFPVLLRRTAGKPQKYLVVGDCCIDGIMYGEAVDWEFEDADDILLG